MRPSRPRLEGWANATARSHHSTRFTSNEYACCCLLLHLSLHPCHSCHSKMTVDLSGYPSAPFLFVSKTLDLVCQPLQCSEWREYVPSVLKQQLSHRIGDVTKVLPNVTTYSEFLNGRESSLEELRVFAFETSSTSLSVLTTREAMMVLVFLVMLIRLCKSILLPFFSSIGRKAGRATHGKDWEANNEIRIVKFGEYVFRLLFHTCISVAGIYYFYDKPWWKPGGTTVLWKGLPFHPIEPGMTWYYLVQSAYNIDALVSLVELSLTFKLQYLWNGKFPIAWSKTVRGDFREMAIHHVVTNLLVLGSSYFRLTRIGSMVFLVHDISDVPVDLSKLANFLKWKRATTICFATMCLLWLVLRLGILPFVIYKSVLTESVFILETGYIDPEYYLLYRGFFYYLVGQIILLHIAWFCMFLRMGYLLAFKGEAHDLSEHKQGEAQHHDNSHGKENGHCATNGHAYASAMNGHCNGGAVMNGKNTH